ncbi:hypothetical protein ABI59_09085 [Acidobacteria bacterium Mor1]|nr:hypothetical protein ABI59_09085 [Acidobacteria bacterium Mor1]
MKSSCLQTLLLVVVAAIATSCSSSGTWEQIGVVGVDSGQLVLLDPAYIEGGDWVPEGQGQEWRVRYWGRDAARLAPDFGESPIECSDAGTAMALEARIKERARQQDLAVFTWAQSGSSYDKCAEFSESARQAGQLNFAAGHPGLGVAFATVHGDGIYPVMGRYDGDLLVEVRIDLRLDPEQRLPAAP